MSSRFVHVANINEIKDGEMKVVEVDGEQVYMVNIKGRFYAINNICTHEGGPLNEGILDGYEIECLWHSAHFDVKTGEVKSSPAIS